MINKCGLFKLLVLQQPLPCKQLQVWSQSINKSHIYKVKQFFENFSIAIHQPLTQCNSK